MGKDIIAEKRLLTEQGIKKAKEEIDSICKREEKFIFDTSTLEPNLKALAELVRKKEHFENERDIFVQLLTRQAGLQKELEKLSKDISIGLERSKIHLPGRDVIKAELAKLKEEEHRIEFLLGHIKQALKRELAPSELVSKIIDAEVELSKLGRERLLNAVDNLLKKPQIAKSDIIKLSQLR